MRDKLKEFARDLAYINVKHNRTIDRLGNHFESQRSHGLSSEERALILKLNFHAVLSEELARLICNETNEDFRDVKRSARTLVSANAETIETLKNIVDYLSQIGVGQDVVFVNKRDETVNLTKSVDKMIFPKS